MASLAHTLIDNPIARAELDHQQRSAARQRSRRWQPIFALGLAIALISNATLLFVPQLAGLIQMPASDMSDLLHSWMSTITILMGALVMIHHLGFATAALQIASTSIAREKEGRTWESLLLTGVDAQRIIFGKWSATMRTLWDVYRPLLVLRFAVALWMSVSGGVGRITPFLSAPPFVSILLISGVTAVFPLCYSAFMVALGLLASLLVASETSAYRVASLFQFASIAISLSLIVLSFALPFSNIEPGLVSLIPALFVTPLDGGMLALIGIIANSGSASLYYLFGLILCITLYAALTWVVLRGGQALAVRQRALPPA